MPTGGGHGIITGLVHALQARYDHFPQGHATAALLGPGMRFTGVLPAPGHRHLTAVLGIKQEGAEGINQAVTVLTDFLQEMDVPLRLRELKIPQSDLEAVAKDCLGEFFTRTNPRPVSTQDALALLQEAW